MAEHRRGCQSYRTSTLDMFVKIPHIGYFRKRCRIYLQYYHEFTLIMIALLYSYNLIVDD